jgi:hypothetical protein
VTMGLVNTSIIHHAKYSRAHWVIVLAQ